MIANIPPLPRRRCVHIELEVFPVTTTILTSRAMHTRSRGRVGHIFTSECEFSI